MAARPQHSRAGAAAQHRATGTARAWVAGRRHARAGLPRTENPHSRFGGTRPLRLAWDAGWLFGYGERRREERGNA